MSDLTADPQTTAARGTIASAGRSYARPDPTRTTRRRRGFEPDFDLSPGLYTELLWRIGPAIDPLPYLTLQLTRVAGIAVDVARAGLAALRASTINVATDTPTHFKVDALPSDTTVHSTASPPARQWRSAVGRHTVTLRTT